MTLLIQQAKFELHQKQTLNLPHFAIEPRQYWVVVGSNGSGKSAFALALQNELSLQEGKYHNSFQRVQSFSFEKQREILEATLKNLNNDDTDPDFFGKTAREMILNGSSSLDFCEEIAEKLGITYLLDRFFIKLSTGETRKVLLAQALLQKPDLLILDEPFEGLDQQSVSDWQQLLQQLNEKMALVLIVNRFSDIPSAADHVALLDHNQLILQGGRTEVEQQSLFQQVQYAEQNVDVPLPESAVSPIKLPPNQSPFELKNVTVQYGENVILNRLDWTVAPEQNWWIKGPNGAGKSTLLSLICGDHPQSYANHVVLFGKQRGSGETIWEIKRNIGYVSSQLHMDYRVNCSALEVILSGFFDSIGVYQSVPGALRIKAMQWLTRLNMEALANRPFRSLSWGQQRLLLITRAMVKHPPILILDEPLQGLDGMNRKLVKHFIEQLVNNSQTQLLFVSHQEQDAPNCITHVFEFIPQGDGYVYKQSAV